MIRTPSLFGLQRILSRITGTGTLIFGGALTADRTKSFQNTTGTIAELESAQTFTVAQTISDTTSAASSITGALKIGNGVAATNVGIGGGNINAGGTLTVGGAATFSSGLTTTGASSFSLGVTASAVSSSTVAGNFPAAAFRNLDVTNNNGLALFFQSYDTGSAVRTAAGITTTFTAKGASSVDGILAFYTTLAGAYGERTRISAAGNLLVGTTSDTGLTGPGGVSIASATSASSSTTGSLLVGNGTASTNVGIGGGNINAGGTGTFGGAISVTATTVSVISNNSSGAPNILALRNTVAAALDNGPQLLFQGDTSVASSAAITALWEAAANTNSYLAFSTRRAGTLTQIGRFTSTGNLLLGTSTDIAGNGGLSVANTTDSTTTTTGSLITAGGLGVAKTLATGSGRILKTRSVVSAAATTTLDSTDHACFLTGATTQTFTLPAAAAGRQLIIKNRSTGALTVNRAGVDTIDGLTTLNVAAGAGIILVANGTDWCVI